VAAAFSDGFVAPPTLGIAQIKAGENHKVDDGVVILDEETNLITGTMRPRLVTKVAGEEAFICMTSLFCKMMKILFPSSFIHSLTPEQMVDKYHEVTDVLKQNNVFDGMKCASSDFSAFDQSMHQGITSIFRWFME